MSRKYLIDVGHGGEFFKKHYGLYTKGKSFKFKKKDECDEMEINEGVINRKMADFIVGAIGDENVCILSPGPWNMPLKQRCIIANDLYEKEPDLIFISLHCNAHKNRNAKGAVIHIPKNPLGIEMNMAKSFRDNFEHTIIPPRKRSIVKSNFAVLRNTNCPSVLIERGFMTNRMDCWALLNETYNMTLGIINTLHQF